MSTETETSRDHRSTDSVDAWLKRLGPVSAVCAIIGTVAVSYARLGDVRAETVANRIAFDEYVRLHAPDGEHIRSLDAQAARVELALTGLTALATKTDRDLTVVMTKMQDAKLIK